MENIKLYIRKGLNYTCSPALFASSHKFG